MKTCRFRGAQPRKFKKSDEGSNGGGDQEETEGMLCQAEPIARYQMTFCYRPNCFLCQWQQLRMGLGGARLQLQLQLENEEKIVPGVDFTTRRAHRFVNKYEAILNCPAVSTFSVVVDVVVVEKHVISLVHFFTRRIA